MTHARNLTTPIGGVLSDVELRALEHAWGLTAGEFVRGTRTGEKSVTVERRVQALDTIKLVVEV